MGRDDCFYLILIPSREYRSEVNFPALLHHQGHIVAKTDASGQSPVSLMHSDLYALKCRLVSHSHYVFMSWLS